MTKIIKNKFILNVSVGIISKLLIILIGLIIPRIILVSYGSEVNGLFNSLNQIFSYIALLEAGIGAASLQSLYRPVKENDFSKISSIYIATRNHFRKITFVYFCIVLLASIFLPFVLISSLSKLQIALVVFLMGISNVLTFWFTSSIKQVIIAKGDSYFINNLSLLITVINAILKIILATVCANIVLIQISHLLVNILHILVFVIFLKTKYKFIDFSAKPDYTALKQRNAFLFHEVAVVVFNSTDAALLALFSGLAVVSKYSVYNMVFVAFNSLFTTVFGSISYVLGQAYSQSREKYIKIHDTFNTYFLAICFALISVCYILILPFITLYTNGITDIEYYDIALPILFSSISLLSVSRKTESFLINVSGYAKNTIPNATIEIIINLVVSIIAVKYFGIYGVLFGTLAALIYRTNDMIIYANKVVLNRSLFKGYKIFLTDICLFLLVVIFNRFLKFSINNYLGFFAIGLLLTVILSAVFLIINSIVSPKSFKFLISNIIHKN